MAASSLTTTASTSGVLSRRTPILRLQADERLVALMREGHDRAFEVLFNRYQSRLLAFCRHLVGSPQDAEDVLQEAARSTRGPGSTGSPAIAASTICASRPPTGSTPWTSM